MLAPDQGTGHDSIFVKTMKMLFKRKYQTIGLILVVGVIFYLLQALTLSQLGHASRRMDTNAYIGKMMNGEDLDGDDGNKHDDDSLSVIRSRNRIVDGESKFNIEGKENLLHDRMNGKDPRLMLKSNNKSEKEATKNHYLENNYVREANKKERKPSNISNGAASDTVAGRSSGPAIRGVHPADHSLYRPDRHDMFQCLKAVGVRIKASRVNDDFCDCPDSSDEPGTSACPDGRFHCHWQFPGKPRHSVPSSRVNDGICDCCDGSDEWADNVVPDFMRIGGAKPPAAVSHAPCSNSCALVLASSKQEEAVRLQGKQLQKAYENQAARELQGRELSRFGPRGVFYPLSKTCHTIKADHYTYTVCPFSSVKQASGRGQDVVLGKTPALHTENGQHVLTMSDGDAHLCPDGGTRSAKIYMACGPRDVLVRVQESERCQYTFTMSTPAAC